MRLLRGEVKESEEIPYVLFGDGARDERIFRAIAEKYDHNKDIKTPQLPIGYPHSLRKTLGLKSLIEAVATYLNITKVRKYVSLIDREHTGTDQEFLIKLRKILLNMGFNIKKIKHLKEGAWKIELKKGAKQATLYIAIQGYRKSIEENLAKLIELKYGEELEPTKQAINKWLKKNRQRDIDLIKKASTHQLEETFPSITTIIQAIIQENCQQ